MSRRTQKSRVVVVPDQPARKRTLDEEEAPVVRHLVRRGGNGKIRNRVHLPENYYGFLTQADGPKSGPWYAVFECTPSFWMNFTLIRLPNDYRRRVLGILNGRDFDITWEHCAIAERVVLRHAHAAYLEALDNGENPAHLVRYEILLEASELEDRFGLTALEPGRWYGLAVVKSEAKPDLDTGILRKFDGETLDVAEEAEAYALTSLVHLRQRPEGPDQFIFDIFESEALVRAFHSRFSEEVVALPDDFEEEELDDELDDDIDDDIDLDEGEH